jgi:hypothetical protein
MAAAALAGRSEQQAGELERVLLNFDRAATRLGAPPGQPG